MGTFCFTLAKCYIFEAKCPLTVYPDKDSIGQLNYCPPLARKQFPKRKLAADVLGEEDHGSDEQEVKRSRTEGPPDTVGERADIWGGGWLLLLSVFPLVSIIIFSSFSRSFSLSGRHISPEEKETEEMEVHGKNREESKEPGGERETVKEEEEGEPEGGTATVKEEAKGEKEQEERSPEKVKATERSEKEEGKEAGETTAAKKATISNFFSE